MNIVQYTPKLQSVLMEFYNRQTVNVPHCYPVKEEEFALAMRGINGKADKNEGGLDFETAFVAIENRTLQAFVQVGIVQVGDNGKTPVGVIRFLGYERGARRAGQTVLEKAEVYLEACNVSHIDAFSQDSRYRFYHFENAGLSDGLDHVQALLGFNGYQYAPAEACYKWLRGGFLRLGELFCHTSTFKSAANVFR